MSSDRDTTRIVRSWLHEGVTELPDRVLDAVFDAVPSTHQRHSTRWPAREFSKMNHVAMLAIGAAAVVVVALLGIRFLVPGSQNIGGLAMSPGPAVIASSIPLSFTGASHPLDAGTYAIDDTLPVRITFDLPPGWVSCDLGPVERGVCAGFSESELTSTLGLGFLIVDNVVADPCDGAREQLDPPVGPSVEDLVMAISSLPGFVATPAADVTVDGFDGKQFEVTAPSGADVCEVGDPGLGTWATSARVNGVGPGEANMLRILDVDGVRLVVAGSYFPSKTSADELSQLRQVIDSIGIEP